MSEPIGPDVHECEWCGDIAECDSIETSPATRYEPADGIYVCRGGCDNPA